MNLFRLKDRNYTNQKFNKRPLLLVLVLLACFAISPIGQAVVPAPDGGYPGFNTAEGQNALFSLTTGSANTAVGWFALFSNAEGSFNTATGTGALLVNTGEQNTAIGAAALLNNMTGGRNAATGTGALQDNTTGSANTANGAFALLSNTEGGYNTAVGDRALLSHTAGDRNTAIGASALLNDTTGTNNTATGAAALFNNSTGSFNTAIGDDALGANTIGLQNTAIGVNALANNTTGSANTALGLSAGSNVTTAGQTICINSAGANVSNACFIAYIRGVQTQNANAIPVLIDSTGQLGTMSSSARFKKAIKPMNKASEAILALKPVTFHYKTDDSGTPQFGLIAEEVAEINPDLVVRDADGNPYTVRYDAVNAMLLNEFLKEHRKVEELKSTVATKLATMADLKSTVGQQQQDIQALAATVKEQASQIQKVSSQLAAASSSDGGLEASKPAPQLALNNP